MENTLRTPSIRLSSKSEPVRGIAAKTIISLFLLLGPYLSVLFLLNKSGGMYLADFQLSMVLKVMLVFWSPLFFTVPALLTQDGRDRALSHLQGFFGSLWRSVILVPWLIVSPKSEVRAETFCSLVGLLVGIVAALPYF